VLKANKKIMLEVDNVLSDLQVMCKSALDQSSEGALKLQLKIPEILGSCNSMQKRLKGSQKVE